MRPLTPIEIHNVRQIAMVTIDEFVEVRVIVDEAAVSADVKCWWSSKRKCDLAEDYAGTALAIVTLEVTA